MHSHRSHRITALAVLIAVGLIDAPVFAQGVSPWLNAVDVLQQAFTGPLARGRFFSGNVIDGHIRSCLTQSQSDGLSDAGIGAGHQRLLTFQEFLNTASRHHHFRKRVLLLLHDRRHRDSPFLALRRFEYTHLS